MSALSDGSKWTVFHQSDTIDDSVKRRIDNSAKTDVEALLMSAIEFYCNYNKVATFDFNSRTTLNHQMLWRLTNNVDEVWLKEFEGQHDNWTMDKHTEENACRSSMVGDIFQDKTNMIWWVIQPMGFKRIFWLDNEEEKSGYNVSPQKPSEDELQ